MRKVRNQKVIRKIADRTRKAGKWKSRIAVLAIALTSLLITTVFTIGGSMLEKQQQETMRQVGGSAHIGYKYLTEKEYETIKNDLKIKEISYRILVGDAVNEKLKKVPSEVSYFEDLDAKFSFCYPETGHMPQKEEEIVTSDLVLKALGIPCELGQKVPLKIDIDGKILEKTFTLCGYFQGDGISMAQMIAVSRVFAEKVAPTPTNSVLKNGMDARSCAGRIMADINFASSWNLEKQAET